jgi:hypothetical protein
VEKAMREAVGRSRTGQRRLLLGSGPLVRGTDRVQRVSRLVVLLAVLAACALASCLALRVSARDATVAARQAAERSQVQAFLLQDAPRSAGPAGIPETDGADPAGVRTRATWAAPQGPPRVGEITVRAGARAGQAVTIWVTRDGTPTTAPLDAGAVLQDAVGVGLETAIGLSLAAGGLHLVVCGALDRRRDRQWTAEWAAVEPVWRGQLQ